MLGTDTQDRIKRTGLAAGVLMCAVASLSGCVPTSYAGISLKPGKADTELQALASKAQAGDKRAQLELGWRYEKGLGVQRNLNQARRLYDAAASGDVSSQQFYSPSVGASGRSQILIISPKRQTSRSRSSRVETGDQVITPHTKREIGFRSETSSTVTKLANREIWRGLLKTVISAQPIDEDKASRILGTSPKTVIPGSGLIGLTPLPPSVAAPLFVYQRLPCDDIRYLPELADQCISKGELIIMRVTGPFGTVLQSDGRTETECPLNSDALAAFRKSRWRVLKDADVSPDRDVDMRGGTELTKGSARAVISPRLSDGEACVSRLEFTVFSKVQ